MGDMSRYVSREIHGRAVVTRRIAGETILVPVAGDVADLEAVYTLNEVGSFVWDLIDGQRSAQAIAEAVCADYEITLEQAVPDVDDLLAALTSRGLVRVCAGPGRVT